MSEIPCSLEKYLLENKKITQKSSNFRHYERVLKIFYFHFLILPNLAKHTHGWSPLDQHRKIEGKKHCNDTNGDAWNL
jgi:hypothetical protein